MKDSMRLPSLRLLTTNATTTVTSPSQASQLVSVSAVHVSEEPAPPLALSVPCPPAIESLLRSPSS